MSSYYKLRSEVMARLVNYLELRQEMLAKEMAPPKFNDLQLKLMIELGVPERMIRKMVETLVPGGTVKDGEIVKIA